MPSTTHHRITRKELKQPDEFISFIDDARDFLLNNLRQVIVSAALVTAVAGIAFGTYTYERHRDKVTGDQFYTALSALNNKQYKSAEEQFTKLAESEPGRRVGKLSRFYLGNAYLADKDLPHARDALVAFVADEHDATFANLALMNLGVVYERMGDYAKAAGAYQQAASLPGPEQVRAQLELARVLAKEGAKDGAIAAYRAFLAAHPYASQRQQVVESLAMLGASADSSTATTSPAQVSMPVVTPGTSGPKAKP